MSPYAACASAVALCLLSGTALSQTPAKSGGRQAPLPAGWEVIDRHLAAAGGRAAFLKLSSRDVWARYEIPARRLRGELRVFSARPDRLVIRTEYPELGVAETGFVESVGWTTEPGSRPTLLKGGALADLHADAIFDRYDEENLLSAETVGFADFEGRLCVKLRVVRVPGRESTEYFDTATGLFAGSVARRDTDKGQITMVTAVSRYEPTDGVLLPRLIRIRAGGVEQIVTIMRVVHNNVNRSIFAVPPKLRDLTP